jgi:hypothetical protein
MQFHFTSRRRRIVAIATSIYSLLWAATATVGLRSAKDAAIWQITYGASVPEVASLDDIKEGPAIAVHGFAIAPFLLRVDYDYSGFIFCGEGATITYVWAPFFIHQVSKHVHWFS